MTINPLLFSGIIVFLVAFIIILLYIINNLLKKAELYEDIIEDQTKYLQNLSSLVEESDQYLKKLDERGVFQSDDEIGTFFNSIKTVQNELNKFKLPSTYGKEEIQS
jgi:predicted PurR-regulated permease PerM|tara:strand:- start:1269 stop:1589 length:321 start_codon:yes stop_codon:yes gene_type:complete